MSGYQSSSHHNFDVGLATQLGSIELAIIVAHFQYWINKNIELDRNFIEGRHWTYQTREEIAANFPYFSSDQVRRFTDKLVELKILKKGNYNKRSLDKTIWYSFENEEMFTIGKSASSIGKSASPIGKFARAIPKSIPKSLTKEILDQGTTKTSAPDKNQGKNLDASRRWKLTEDQIETFEWLKAQGIDAEEKKLAYWAKTHTWARLNEVFNEAKYYKAKSFRKYMSPILDENRPVSNPNTEANRQFALDFAKQHGWGSLKVYKKYVSFKVGKAMDEINLDLDPAEFIKRMIDKHELSERQR